MFYLPRLNRIKLLLLISIFVAQSNFALAQVDDCAKRQFYSKFCSQNDTIVYITTGMLYDSVKCLYAMSTADNYGNELDVNISSFKFKLLRNDSILYSASYDTYNMETIPALISQIKNYNIMDGDLLYFFDMKIKHYSNKKEKYCIHNGLQMIRIVDNVKKYPRRLYMDVSRE